MGLKSVSASEDVIGYLKSSFLNCFVPSFQLLHVPILNSLFLILFNVSIFNISFLILFNVSIFSSLYLILFNVSAFNSLFLIFTSLFPDLG